MREILFRGKREDNGQWVIGFLSKTRGLDNKLHICIDYEEKGLMCSSIVVPTTVGQYTGLTDNNGKKIFEGDILKRKHKELVNHSQKMTVNYIPYKACFSVVDIGGGNVTFISDYINNKYELEVIGNIHDNPELLEIER